MRVLFITGGLGSGGAARQFMELVRGIVSFGVTPVVCTVDKNQAEYESFFSDTNIKHYSFQRKYAVDILVIKKMLQVIKRENVCLIQSWQPLAGLYGVMLSKLSGKKIVCSSIRDAKPVVPLKRAVSNKIQAGLSDVFVSNTKAGFNVQFKSWKKNFKVIPNGIDLDRFKNIDHAKVKSIREQYSCDNYFNILMAANLRKNKDPFTLIKAVKLLVEKKKKVQTFIIGEGEIKIDAVKLAEELQVGEYIRFLGYKHNIEEYIAAFDVSVLLAETKAFQEGISNFLLESMALKKIVVATRGGGNLELIHHRKTGYLVNPYDAEDLCNVLLEIMSGYMDKTADNAYCNIVQNYGMDRYLRSYFRLYAKLVDKRITRTV